MQLRHLTSFALLALLAACASDPAPPPPMTYVIMPEPCGPDSGQDPAACAEAAQEEDYSGDYGTPYSYYPAPSPPFYSGPAVAPVLPAKPITPPRQPAPPPRPKPIKAPRPTPSCPKGAKNCSLNKLKSWAPP